MFKIYVGFSFVWGYAQLVAGIQGTNSHEQENTLKKVTNEGGLNGMVSAWESSGEELVWTSV